MSEPTVLEEVEAGVTVLTLNRPDKLNAFNEAMHARLIELIDKAEADGEINAVVLTGAGRAFSAGQDLGDRAMGDGGPPDLGETLDRLYNPLVRRIRSSDLIFVAAVNGIAAGAAANLALACDLVLAGRSASFMQAFAKIGLMPDCGGTWLLPRLVGETRAKALALLAPRIDAEKACEWGLIWAVHDDDALLTEAKKTAHTVARGAARANATIKKGIQAAAENTLGDQLDFERDRQRELGRTEDYREGSPPFSRSAQLTSRAAESLG